MENRGKSEWAGVREPTSVDDAGETCWESSDVSCDVSSILRTRRWEQREGPFQGFGSPEGKF